MTDKELFGNSEQLNCSDCVNHGGDWDCDHVHCRKGADTISRQAAIDAVAEGLKRAFVENRDIAEKMIGRLPSAQLAQDLPNGCTDTISRQAAIDANTRAVERSSE